MTQARISPFSKIWARFGYSLDFIQELVVDRIECPKAEAAQVCFLEAVQVRRFRVARWLAPLLDPGTAWRCVGQAASVGLNDVCRQFIKSMPASAKVSLFTDLLPYPAIVWRRVLKAGANPNGRVSGRIAFHEALCLDDYKPLRECLRAGADPLLTNKVRNAAIHEAAWRRSRSAGAGEMIRLLVRYGADVNARGFLQSTPLHFAAQGGTVSRVRALLDCGADPNAKDSARRTPLNYCCMFAKPDKPTYRQYRQCITMLLKAGADPSAQDRFGQSILTFAIGKADLMRLLLQAGAVPDTIDKDGKTLLDLAREFGKKRMTATILKEFGARCENSAHGP